MRGTIGLHIDTLNDKVDVVGLYVKGKFVDLSQYKRNCHIQDETLAETVERLIDDVEVWQE